MNYVVNIKAASFTVGANPPEFDAIASFDFAGRLIGVYRNDPAQGEPVNYRRGYDNRIIALVKDPFLTNKLVQRLDDRRRDDIVRSAYDMAADALNAVPDLSEDARSLLQAALGKGPAGLDADADAFRSIYGSIPILPPDQYRAVVLQVTRGCPFNTCRFCTFYRDRDFRVHDTPAFAEHLRRVREFLGPSLRLRQSAFIGDANAILVRTDTLLERIEQIHEVFEIAPAAMDRAAELAWKHEHPEGLAGFYAFLDGLTGTRKTVDDYKALARAGLRRVYIGAESGCDEVLALVDKPCRREGVIETATACRQAGIHLGLIFLAGLTFDDPSLAERHIAESIDLVARLQPGADDIIYLSPLVDEHNPPAQLPAVVNDQLTRLQKGMAAVAPHARIVPYDIRAFIY